MSLLQLNSLSKRYGDHVAVDAINLSVEQGQIFGLLGPNGAGKTTTISMVAGVVTPSQGTAVVAGHDVMASPRAAREAIGLVPQDLALYEEITAQQNLTFFGKLYRLGGKDLRARIDWALDVAGLRDRANEPVEQFSGGMKRRLNLAVGLLHKPLLLILDEPTVGVDPQSRNYIFDTIRALRDEHKMTVLYTSHYMEEVEALCKRVAIMDHGAIIAHDSVDSLLQTSAAHGVMIELEGNLEAAREAAGEFGEASVVDGVLHVTCGGAWGPVITAIESSGATVLSMRTLDASLETLFLKLTGHRLRDD